MADEYFQVGEQCYSGKLAAAHAAAAATPPTQLVISSSRSVCQVSAAGTEAAPLLEQRCAGQVNVVSTGYQAQPCGLLTPPDAAALGWQIGGAWLVVGLLMFLRRTFR